MALDMSLSDNMILETHGDKKFSRCGWIDYDKVNQYTGEMIEKYNVKATGYTASAGKSLRRQPAEGGAGQRSVERAEDPDCRTAYQRP